MGTVFLSIFTLFLAPHLHVEVDALALIVHSKRPPLEVFGTRSAITIFPEVDSCEMVPEPQ